MNWRSYFDNLGNFQQSGITTYKPGLDNVNNLIFELNLNLQSIKFIHIAGTNGKGSVSSYINSILIEEGYKVGLFTSPYFLDYKEQIKINGIEINENYIIDFILRFDPIIKKVNPSLFELTVVIMLCYFIENNVKIAVIETGLGGREDATNVINPILSIITNVSYDHLNILGNTLDRIAYHKAGIIKNNSVFIKSEKQNDIDYIFENECSMVNIPLHFAENYFTVSYLGEANFKFHNLTSGDIGYFKSGLDGYAQCKNLPAVLTALLFLKDIVFCSFESIKNGIENVLINSKLFGRFQTVNQSPRVIIDIAHNFEGVKLLFNNLESLNFSRLFLIIGFLKDKEIEKICSIVPNSAHITITLPKSERAADPNDIYGFIAKKHTSVNCNISPLEAIRHFKSIAEQDDIICVFGSTFLISEIIENYQILS